MAHKKGASSSRNGRDSNAQRRGMWARMVAVALVVSVLTVVVGVVWLAPSAGREAGWWVHRATGSLEQWRESAQRAWPYLRKAWNAFR